MYAIEPTTKEHIVELSKNLRESDKMEIQASHGRPPYEAIRDSVAMSPEPLTGLVDGKVMCIFGVGVASPLSTKGSPWLLGSDLVDEHSKIFLKLNKVWLEAVKDRYEELENYVDVRNKKTIVWLRWLGFKIHKPEPYGVEGRLFRKFELRR